MKLHQIPISVVTAYSGINATRDMDTNLDFNKHVAKEMDLGFEYSEQIESWSIIFALSCPALFQHGESNVTTITQAGD